MTSLTLLALLLLAAPLFWAAASDALRMRIPNLAAAATALAYPAAALLAGPPLAPGSLAGWGGHLLSGLLVFAAGFLFFRRGLLGGGDVKLFAAAALWQPLGALLPFLVLVSLAGALLAGALYALRRAADGPFPWILPAAWARAAGRSVPYGVAIAAGTILALPPALF